MKINLDQESKLIFKTVEYLAEGSTDLIRLLCTSELVLSIDKGESVFSFSSIYVHIDID